MSMLALSGCGSPEPIECVRIEQPPPPPPKRDRCIVLDGGAFWNCRADESAAIMDVCQFGGDVGCEDAARAAVDRVWIDHITSENAGSKALYEMNAAAVKDGGE